ncbi:MAG TPA: two-component system regulatory protein YycI [Bacillota bacterium]|nr:two-component system regulatory protein YycI [Bacillota bacterium]
MQWSQIKTLFIIAFLILNFYLLIQLLEQKEETDLTFMEREESSIEEQLAADDISLPDLPDAPDEEPYISVKQQSFDKDDLKAIKQLDDQKPVLLTEHLIFSTFEDPFEIKEDMPSDDIEERILNKVNHSSDYSYWNWNKDLNIIIFFQKQNERRIYYNQNGMLLAYLNDDNEVTHYTQSMLQEGEAMEDKESLIEPLRAVETIYNMQELNPGDSVSNVEIGFHTRVPLENGVQVFVPTWRVTVNDDVDYLVNAIEGFSFSGDENVFLKQSLESNEDLINQSEDLKDDDKEKYKKFFKRKLEQMNRSGNE